MQELDINDLAILNKIYKAQIANHHNNKPSSLREYQVKNYTGTMLLDHVYFNRKHYSIKKLQERNLIKPLDKSKHVYKLYKLTSLGEQTLFIESL